VIIDVVAVRTLADLFRREQAAGRCLDPDQAAAAAVTQLLALGYRRTGPVGSSGTRVVAPRPEPEATTGARSAAEKDSNGTDHPDAAGTTLARP